MNNIYKIRIFDLKNGSHKYNFQINDSFFKDFSESEINKGQIEVAIVLEKHEHALILHIKLAGKVKTNCDRCTEEFDLPILTNQMLIAEFGAKDSDLTDADEKIIIARDSSELNLAKHLYDYIQLSLPIRKIHPEDQEGNSFCNPEMLELIEKINKKRESINSDPRWDDLKGFLTK